MITTTQSRVSISDKKSALGLSKAARPGEASGEALPKDSVTSAEVTDVAYSGYLKFKNYHVGITTDDVLKRYNGGFVHGPGHHIGAIAAMVFDEQMNPHAILKTGDTRLSRAERQEPYVQDGFIAGRMDKKGSDASKIALSELAEEVGGEVVQGTFRPLGSKPNPTMPLESTESDYYYAAAVEIKGNPYGDGGDMELTDLIGPKFLPADEALKTIDSGGVSEGSRSRVLYGRGFDSIGYVPQLGAYVKDHPKLAERFDTLGLGEVQDIRATVKPSRLPEPRPKADTLEANVNDVVLRKREEVPFSDESRMIKARTSHAVNNNGTITPLEAEFPNEYLQLDYDRAKVATYYVDEKLGPMVQMKSQARPALAFAPGVENVVRKDVSDIKLSRGQSLEDQLPPGARSLGAPTGASPGQTDLFYHFVSHRVEPPENPKESGFVSLAEAVKLCRTGHGDVQTEALCERLADDLDWIPNLGMTTADAKKLMSQT